ncbi:MAG: PEGA domain-containing protein [Vicinamibacterales bacterium]
MLHQVGAGVLGPVFRALDPADERTVAIKLFRLDLTPEQASDLAAQLLRLVERLPVHEGLVRPLAAGTEGTLPFLVTDYAGADSIDQRLRRKVPTPLAEVTAMLEQVAAALDTAAAAGIHHGALHPRDVLVTTVSSVRLTGLGVTQALEQVGYRLPFRRPYAAPERVAGRQWDQRADVFAVGVLALELGTGRRPLLPESGSGFNLLPDDDPRADAVSDALMHALDEDPARRDSQALEWVARLRVAMEASGPVDEVASPVPPREAPHLQDTGVMRLPDAPDVTSELDVELPWELPEESATMTDAALAAAAAAESFPPPSESSLAIIERAMTGDSPSADQEVPEASPQDDWRTEGTAALDVALHDEPDEPLARLDVVRPSANEAATDSALARTETSSTVEKGDDRLPPASPTGAFERRSRWPALAAAAVVGIALSLYYLSADRTLEPIGEEIGSPVSVDVPPAAATTPATPAPAPRTVAPNSPAPAQPPPRAEPRATSAANAARARPTVAPAKPAQAKPSPVKPNPAIPVPAPPVTGRLLVRSSPAGATVTIDGVAHGQTPVVLRDLGLGSHTVAIARPGYVTVNRAIVLTADTPSANVVVDLLAGPATVVPAASPPSPGTRPSQPPVSSSVAAPTASLQVVSVPPGARVFLNGRAVGTTPLRVSNLPSSSHAVRVEADGYREWSGTVRLDAGLVAHVSATLEPAGER